MLLVVDLNTDEVLTLPLPRWVNDVSISPDGRRVVAVSGYAGDGIYLIDVETADVQEVANPIVEGLTSVEWSPDGRHIAAGGFNSTVPVMDANGATRIHAPRA